jgi:hypothetical protein
VRIFYKKLGGHYHMRLFLHGKLGDLCVGERDWDDFRACFGASAFFIEETESDRIFDAYSKI